MNEKDITEAKELTQEVLSATLKVLAKKERPFSLPQLVVAINAVKGALVHEYIKLSQPQHHV